MTEGNARRVRGSYTKGRAKRAEILRHAVVVFAESGYRGGSLKEIADGVGLTQAGLLHHFSSKEQLLAEVLDQRDDADQRRLDGERGWAFLEAVTELVRHNATVPGLVQLYATLSGEAVAEEHPAHGFFVGRYRRIRELMADALREAKADGRLAADVDVDATAVSLVALMDGLQIQWLLDRDTVDMPAVLEAFLARLRPR
ncbi:TetR family transcriptional regulator [Catenuloplanes atrovinosus]|uniref:AcrR family transcriptional regulator n=1 Tax=Catenuloplanes atrovinosus TaxID=137266 RepID=A0AAE4CC16_9ACTN|nr:TetR family transcriptional regulator [Catenuloplanes atrovinosus]MDR7279191.1 AcrR family transcriptional regulator [Catenuloplanes atrovinosus]